MTTLAIFYIVLYSLLHTASSEDDKLIYSQATEWYRSTVNYWPFEDVTNRTVTDFAGFNDGKVSGSFYSVSGIVGSALALSGNKSWVDFGVLPSSCLNRPSTCDSGFTIAFWLKIPAFQGNRIILQLGGHRFSRGFTVWTRRSTKKNIGFSVNTRLRKYQWLQEWNSGDWNHIALKWNNKTASLKIYVNCTVAQVVNKSEVAEPVQDDKASRLILGASHALKKNIKVVVDEFAIWDRPLSDKALCDVFHIRSVNGNYSEWSEFSACSVTCGNGTKKRNRTCTSPPPKNLGKNCSALGDAEEAKSCFLTMCPIHGDYSEWSVFSNCSKSCGTGIKRRTRKCSNPEPERGGRNCSRLGLPMEVKKCHMQPCSISGGYSSWTVFSPCTVSCGNGTRQRSRICSNPKPMYGGRNCSHLGSNVEIEICNTNFCPIHGGFSEWTKFSECTKSCGDGSRTRTRNCSNPEPRHGGSNCSIFGANKEIQICNTHNCPIHGSYTQWTEFSECTKSCGNGSRTRTRNCSNPEPKHGGNDCSILGAHRETHNCNTHNCPINGGYTQWTEFSECTKSCGIGKMKRTRNCSNPVPQHGGSNCLHLGLPVDVQRCFLRNCPVHGGFSEWTKFSACSRTCGVGLKNRTRECTNPQPMHGGDDCSGIAIDFKVCNVSPCPINGNYTQWSAFSVCSKTCAKGIMKRTRNCSHPVPKFGGNDCSLFGPAEEVRECNTFPCPVNGNYSVWSNFSLCSKSCGNGTMERHRTCSNPTPKHGGSNCSSFGPSKEIRSCNVFPCVVHGNFSSWSIFSVCSKSCGNGTKTRTRNCSNPFPKHGGRNCSILGPLTEVQTCNVFPCPVHGNYSSWSNVSSCTKSCGNGTRVRTRNCSNPTPKHGGSNCSLFGLSKEVRTCNVFPCPVHGNYSSWSNFSICTKSCGNGTRVRTRNCSNPTPKHGGRNCSLLDLSKEVRTCNVFPCPVHGNYSSWSNFSICTKSCSNGTMTRSRRCTNPAPRHNGHNCSSLGPSRHIQPCNVFPCPVDGGYTVWGNFTQCTQTCGNGTMHRTRNCSNPVPLHGGKNCSVIGPSIDVITCDLHPCPIDGGYSWWSKFSKCTRSCNGGTQRRWRQCTDPVPKHGGRDCVRRGPAEEVRMCNTFPCPVHGGYSEWTGFEACTRTCGGGMLIRRRSCTSPPPAHGGRNCNGLGPSIDTIQCNTEKCPDIVFHVVVNLTSEKWEAGLAEKNNQRASLLSLKITFGVKEIMGKNAVSGVTNFSFIKGSVIAEFSVSLFHRFYKGITPLQDAIYSKGAIVELSVSAINLTSPDVPVMAPVNITAMNTSSTTIRLKWLPIPVNYSNGPILEYRITCIEAESNDIAGLWQKIVDGEKLSAHLTGLDKFTPYRFRMAGVNRRGVGVDSMPIIASTDEDKPTTSPSSVTASNRSSTTIYVEWSPIPEQFINGIPLGYHIHYTNLDPEGFGDVSTGIHPTEAGSMSTLMQGLLKFTNYRIQVSGFTVKGDGPLSNAVFARTEEDVPSRPPANVTGNNVTSTSIIVRWNPIPPRYVHGILLGYNVFFIATDGGNERRWNGSAVNQFARSAVITNLRKFTKYMVTVEGLTSKGSGLESKCVAITTAEDIPEAYPLNVTGFNKSSTSLFVEWQHIPPQHRNGILLGYKISYAPRKSYQPLLSVTVDDSRSSTTLLNLKKYTWYVITVAGFTSKGLGPQHPRLEIRTSEDVPSQPAISVKARNTSHTSLFVQWNEIPPDFIHGVLLGYRVLFWRYNESRDTYETKQLGPEKRSVHLRDLWIYTKYKIQVLGFTAVGEGSISQEIVVSTDEFTPSQAPIKVRALNKTSPTEITVQWNQIPDKFYVHGILRGYKVLYKAIAIANEKLEEDMETSHVIIRPSILFVVLKNLTAFTRYEIQVLAFTIKGDGVKSIPIIADTCNCFSTMFTNWWMNPPYADSPHSNKSGIITPILKQAVYTCCGNCTEHGTSRVDFTRTATGHPARKPGLLQFKRSFEETTELHFPVYGFMDQTRYSDNYGFVPFVQSPGLALIIIGDEKGTAATLLLKSLALCFPILFLSIAMLWVSSLVMWFVETASNERHFPRNVIHGSWEAMWWAFASMTTLGYGDRIPKTPFGRLVCLLWILMGLVMITCFNSTMTTLLTARILDKDVGLYGTKIAAIQNSSGYRLAIRKNARVNQNGKEYTNLPEVYEALTNREVKGMLIDAYTVGSKKELFNRRDLRISKLLDYSAAYGAVLGGEAKKLQKCFQKYVNEQRSEISKIVEDNVDTIEVTPKSMSVERSSSLFDPGFPTYINSVIVCGVLLAVLWLVGAKFEFAKKMGWIKFKGKAKEYHPLPRCVELMRYKAELKSEMSKIVTMFKINCSCRIQALRQKHKKELLHLAKLNKQADSMPIQRSSFHRDSLFTFTFGPKTPEHNNGSQRNGHTKLDSSLKEPGSSEMETIV